MYFRGLIISLIYSIISTILNIISLIILAGYKAETDNEKTAKKLALALVVISIIFDWILTLVLFLYKKSVENLCEPKPTIQPTSNTPLFQPNYNAYNI